MKPAPPVISMLLIAIRRTRESPYFESKLSGTATRFCTRYILS
jgi:hypothetical protein